MPVSWPRSLIYALALLACAQAPALAGGEDRATAAAAAPQVQHVLVARTIFDRKHHSMGEVLYAGLGPRAKRLFEPYPGGGAVSGNGRYLAYVDGAFALRLGSLVSGRSVVLYHGGSASGIPDAMAFSPDSSYLAYSVEGPGAGIKLRVYNIELARRRNWHTATPLAITAWEPRRASSNGATLAIAFCLRSPAVHTWVVREWGSPMPDTGAAYASLPYREASPRRPGPGTTVAWSTTPAAVPGSR